MTGFLLDENLPSKLQVSSSYSIQHCRDLGTSLSDEQLWNYAKTYDLVIVTKDSDFSNRILLTEPPPRIVHLRFGNMRLNEFHNHLVKVWPRVEELIATHKLVNVYKKRLEAVI